MNRRLLCIVLFAALACATPGLRAQDGLQGALSRDGLAQTFRSSYTSLFERRSVMTDFDGDQRLDGAVLLHFDTFQSRNSFRVEVHLSARNNTELTFESTEDALSIAALDVNHDGTTDLVVEQAFTHRRLYVWLGDGRGSFRQGRVEDFPTDGAPTGRDATRARPQIHYVVLSLPTEHRFETTLLKASHVSGRPPSTEQFAPALPTSSQLLRLVASFASRAPPLCHSI